MKAECPKCGLEFRVKKKKQAVSCKSQSAGWKPERLESTHDFWEFYQHLHQTARTMLKEADPHDLNDFRLIELTDLSTDANQMMRMLCKRAQSLIKRIEKVSNDKDNQR